MVASSRLGTVTKTQPGFDKFFLIILQVLSKEMIEKSETNLKIIIN